MMFIPGLRVEMRVLALLLIVYFMSLTWTGKVQYSLCLPLAARTVSSVVSIRRRSDFRLQNWTVY